MRTSPFQFETLVSFMEQHGDLSKPQGDASCRLWTLKKWEELTTTLNNDVTGDSKNSTKWKKVWADFKNNTKRKLSRVQKAEREGEAVRVNMSAIEKRVLQLVGVPLETNTSEKNMTVEDAGSISDEEVSNERKPSICLQESLSSRRLSDPEETNDGPPKPISDDDWRQFRIQQHKDYIALKREQLRIREMEVRAQMGWQEIGNRAIDLLDKLVTKYCQDSIR